MNISGVMMVCLGCGLALRDLWAINSDDGSSDLPDYMKVDYSAFPIIQRLEKLIAGICTKLTEATKEYVICISLIVYL